MTDERDTAEVELIRRARTGDADAVRALIDRNIGWLMDRVRRRLGAALRREFDSGDVVQDIVVTLLTKDRLAGVEDERHFRALLALIVDNDLRDRLRWAGRERRDRGREEAPIEDGQGDGRNPFDSVTRPSQHLDRTERIGWIRAGLERLPADDRALVRRRVWQQEPFASIATDFGITEDAARMRFNRALARLARAVAGLRGAAPTGG